MELLPPMKFPAGAIKRHKNITARRDGGGEEDGFWQVDATRGSPVDMNDSRFSLAFVEAGLVYSDDYDWKREGPSGRSELKSTQRFIRQFGLLNGTPFIQEADLVNGLMEFDKLNTDMCAAGFFRGNPAFEERIGAFGRGHGHHLSLDEERKLARWRVAEDIAHGLGFGKNIDAASYLDPETFQIRLHEPKDLRGVLYRQALDFAQLEHGKLFPNFCQWCHRPFLPRRNDARFCSPPCRSQDHRSKS